MWMTSRSPSLRNILKILLRLEAILHLKRRYTIDSHLQYPFFLLDEENKSRNLDQHLPFCLETQNRRRKLLPQKNCRRPSAVSPKGSKTVRKTCSECIAFGTCDIHCNSCNNALPCSIHLQPGACSNCMPREKCAIHKAIEACRKCTRTRKCAVHKGN